MKRMILFNIKGIVKVVHTFHCVLLGSVLYLEPSTRLQYPPIAL